ncbi:hypothetical protein IF1G_09715 [Cordyceps javanica]|uniref:Uncharacterized protein n=1 Tax=Cordyceps javanica TaxID=43265 RepID=A0A545UQD8_9HYPO|nr:hypothetical protein IF1G_09715 [Cordyceps javanica]
MSRRVQSPPSSESSLLVCRALAFPAPRPIINCCLLASCYFDSHPMLHASLA